MKLEERVERLERQIQGLALELAEIRKERQAAAPLVEDSWKTDVQHPISGHPPQALGPQAGPPGAPAAGAGMSGGPGAQRHPAPPVDWEMIGRVWLPRIFIVVLLLGVLWGFVAAVNAGMITRPVRCWIGIAAAAFMFASGVRQVKHKREALGQVLLGGAHAVLVLSLFAAHMLYGFLSVPLAAVLYGAAIILFAATALVYHSQSLMLAAMTAGCLVPFLIHSENPNFAVLAGYEGLFAAAVLLLSRHFGFRLSYVASYGLLQLSLMAAVLTGGTGGIGGDEWWILSALLLQQAIFFVLCLNEKREEVSYPERRVLVFTSFALTSGWAYLLIVDSQFKILLALCAAVYSLSAYGWLPKKRGTGVLLAVTATLGWMLLLLNALPGSYTGAALAAEGTLALALGLRIRASYQQGAGCIVFAIGALQILGELIPRLISPETWSWIMLLAGLTVIHRLVLRYKQGPRNLQIAEALLWAVGVLGLAFLTQLTLAAARPLETDSQRLILSAVWVVYAIALIAAGILLQRPKARMAGILLVLLTLLKVIFIDVPGVSTAVRAILFIGLGLVGIVVSRFMYHKQKSG